MLINTNQVVTKTDLRMNLAEIMAAVKNGEEKIISERGKIIARMTPVKKSKKNSNLIREYESLSKKLSKYSSKLDSTAFVRKMRDERK
ncbi:MAG: type II toxin-antitoxin system prevent-host-death family antitoxin [Candidatus Beckwithbacteria bacterium]|nr:type II toxin-antitoxin system prevent-host-death family antitoxin [Patescibacteria group bacterium]